MKNRNNLDTVRQFPIKQPIWKRHNAITANRLFVKRPKLRVPANLFAGFRNCVQKCFAKSIFLLIVKLQCFDQFNFGYT